jgi:hypothetical protein
MVTSDLGVPPAAAAALPYAEKAARGIFGKAAGLFRKKKAAPKPPAPTPIYKRPWFFPAVAGGGALLFFLSRRK